MATILIAEIVRTRVRPPKLALLPATKPPGGGLLLSVLVHSAAVFALLTWLPLLIPGRPIIVTNLAAEMLREPDHEVLMFPVLPRIVNSGSLGQQKSRPEKMALSSPKAGPEDGDQPADRPKPNYAGPQEIVSSFPDSTNIVQTIRRPDLVAPPKLKYPLRLPSQVMLPAPSPQAPVAPQVDQPLQPVVPNPVELSTLQASEARVQIPVLPMGVPKQSLVVPAEVAAPKISGASDHGLPQLPQAAPPAPKAVVVINAVGVPPESAPVIPDAELSGNFVVGPSSGVTAGNSGPTVAGGGVAGTGASDGGGNSSHASAGGTSTTGAGTNGSQIGAARNGSLSITGGRLGSGGGAGTTTGSGNGSMPGISISGGAPGRSGRAVATSTVPRGSYAITIISGGSSGGATRDLGVFSRGDTVYTVYIPMADAGGGPDWPIEYALISGVPTSNGLLTPPVALKKIQATGPKTTLPANSGPVFVTGIIDEKGKLHDLRAIRVLDDRAQFAVNALSRWEFLPAQLDGKPVASKVLIGVSIRPAEEVAKQN